MRSIAHSLGFALALGALAAAPAFASTGSLSLKFGGGCHAADKGSCVLKVTARGGDLTSETVVFQSAATRTGHFRNITSRLRSLSSGRAQISFHNVAACYRAVTGPNGNDKPDVRSNVICE